MITDKILEYLNLEFHEKSHGCLSLSFYEIIIFKFWRFFNNNIIKVASQWKSTYCTKEQWKLLRDCTKAPESLLARAHIKWMNICKSKDKDSELYIPSGWLLRCSKGPFSVMAAHLVSAWHYILCICWDDIMLKTVILLLLPATGNFYFVLKSLSESFLFVCIWHVKRKRLMLRK